jgi:hypothetical protein
MSIRVLHCPTTVGGNPQQLARAERALGLDSLSITFQQNVFQYPADEVLLQPGESRLKLELLRWGLLRRALREFDLIHFNFGSTIMPSFFGEVSRNYSKWFGTLYSLYARALNLRDLPILSRAGKGIVVTYQGDDARQGDYTREHFPINVATEVEPGYYTARSDAQKRRNIARVARYADQIYAVNPDLLHVLPSSARFMPYANIDVKDWKPVISGRDSGEPLKILHAPTHRRAKGTKYVLDAINQLQQQDGIDLELILVENMSHDEAVRAYQGADLLVDQLFAGWYGGLAVELMALGKPVICYMREEDFKFLPTDMRAELPLINATPSTLYAVLKEWVTTRRGELPERGRRSRAYVEHWHDPLKIAADLKSTYETILAASRK